MSRMRDFHNITLSGTIVDDPVESNDPNDSQCVTFTINSTIAFGNQSFRCFTKTTPAALKEVEKGRWIVCNGRLGTKNQVLVDFWRVMDIPGREFTEETSGNRKDTFPGASHDVGFNR